MATELAKAYVQIVPSAEGISRGIESIMNGSDVSAATTKAGSSIGSTLIKGIGASLIAGTAAVASAAAGLWKGINATAEVGDNIDKTSQKLGVTTDQYQAMAYAAEHCGFSTSVLNTAQKTLAGSDFSGNIYDAIGYIQTLGSEEERTAYAAELFGAKAAQQMQPLINGSMTMDEYAQSLSDIGGMMSNDAVLAAAAFEDSLTDLQTSISGAKNGIMAEFLPGCTEVMNGLTMLFSGQGGGAEMVSSGLKNITSSFTAVIPDIVSTLTSLLPSLLDAGKEIFVTLTTGILNELPSLLPVASNLILELANDLISMLPQILELGLQIILELANGIAESLPDLIPTIVDVVLSITETLIDNIDKLVDGAIAIIVGLANGLINAMPRLIQKVPTIVVKLVSSFIANAPKLAEAALQLMVMLGESIVRFVPQILSKIPEVVSSIKEKFLDKFQVMKDIGKNIVTGLWEGIRNVKDWLLSKISGFVDDVVAGIKDFFGIHSPSKLMSDEVGKWIPAGIGVGIEANADSVYSAMDKLGDGMLSANLSGNLQTSNSEEMMYRAFSRALTEHSIQFNDRELGRLVRAYA